MRAYAYTSIQLAAHLGRPIHAEDYNRNVDGTLQPTREFFGRTFLRNLHRKVPTEFSETPVLACLDAGRWIALCPGLGCRGAEKVGPADPIFLCMSCGSGDVWWPVEFPNNKAAIDREVAKRENANGWAWNPGETMVQLRRETRALAALEV